MVTVIRRQIKKIKKNNWSPEITIVNTDLRIINEVVTIFEELRIPHHVQSKKDHSHPMWKIKYEVIIAGLKRCGFAIPCLVNHLIAKKEKMLNMEKWIEYRLKLPHKSPYTQIDFLNKIRESSITLRDFT